MVNRWLLRFTLLYAVWFISGLVLLNSNWLFSWHDWVIALFLTLGGITSLAWYTRKYGVRQALILFIVCSSISYTADWIGARIEVRFGSSVLSGHDLTPLVFGIPLAIPFAWCMLLIIAKAFAPTAPSPDVWRGMSVFQKKSDADWKRQYKRNRSRERRRSFWLPAIWTAGMAVAIGFLFVRSFGRSAHKHDSGYEIIYDTPLRYFCWWLIALLMINVVNYLHDEYIDRRNIHLWPDGFVPLMLLLTLESFFLTLAIKSGLWWPVILNIGTLLLLFLWRHWILGLSLLLNEKRKT